MNKEGWQIKTLGDIADVKGGKRVPKGYKLQSVPTKYPYITVSDFTDEGTIDTSDLRYVSREVFEQIKRYTISSNDLYLSIAGTIGKTGYVPIELDGASLTENACKLVLRPGIDRNFVYYFTKSDGFTTQAGTNTRTAAQPKLALERLKTIKLPIPLSFPEQQRIVGILDEAFDGIATAKANAEKNLQNARALFESHLHGANAGKASLGDFVDIKTGKLDANEAVEGGKYPFFTCSRDIYAINNYAFDCEAILLAGNNAVGDFNVKHYNGKFNAYQRTYVITVNEKRRVHYRFLYYQMRKNLKKFKDQSVGAGTKFLKIGMIKDMEIALPSLPEQEQIVSIIDALSKKTERLESLYQRKLAALDALKKSLLHQAFTGQL